jgi:hypothetical protein
VVIEDVFTEDEVLLADVEDVFAELEDVDVELEDLLVDVEDDLPRDDRLIFCAAVVQVVIVV